MTWTKVTRTTGDWAKTSNDTQGWGKVFQTLFGNGWFVGYPNMGTGDTLGWFETGWFIGPSADWSDIVNTTSDWTKLTNSTGEWTKIR